MEPSITYFAIAAAGVWLAYAMWIRPLIEEAAYVRQTKSTPGCELPYTQPTAMFGLQFLANVVKLLREHRLHEAQAELWLATPNRTYRKRLLGNATIHTLEPENIKAILSTQFNDFGLGMRYEHFKPLLGDSIFTLSGPMWAHTRALLRPMFTKELVSQLDTLQMHTEALLNVIKAHNNSTSDFLDMQPLFFKLTLDTSSEFVFGESTSTLTKGASLSPERAALSHNFEDMFNRSGSWLVYRVLLQKYYFLLPPWLFGISADRIKSYVDEYVHQALEDRQMEKQGDGTDKGKYVFLKELAKETSDPILMRDQAMAILAAGRDTTASLLSFAVLLLATNPQSWAKLREAVLAEFGTDADSISFSSLKRCVYLRNVVNESLRLRPIVPSNLRYATHDTTLPRGGGPDQSSPILVKKGSPVLYSVFALHRDPRFWGLDANEFRPERWETQRVPPWVYIPFNGGPRICLGQQVALTEASFVLCRLAQTFTNLETTAQIQANGFRQRVGATARAHEGAPLRFYNA